MTHKFIECVFWGPLICDLFCKDKYFLNDDNTLVTSEVNRVEHCSFFELVNVPLLYFLYELPRRSFDLI